MTPEENLLAAAEYLSEYGHNKGQYYSTTGARQIAISPLPGGLSAATRARYHGRPACAIGALFMTGDNYDMIKMALSKLEKLVGGQNVPAWNDRSDTTAEDVILAMKRAANNDTE